MRQPSLKARLTATAAAFLLAGTAAGAIASSPAAAGELGADGRPASWRLYPSVQPVDAWGNPSIERYPGITLTVTAGSTTATCTTSAASDETDCAIPAEGLRVAKGGTYTITASNLPTGTVAGNVGTFTMQRSFPGPQCEANHAGLVDPCHHLVTVGPARSDAPLLPGGVDLNTSKIDGDASDDPLVAPVEVTVAEDGAATVTTFSDDGAEAERAGAAASPASTDPGSATAPTPDAVRARGADRTSGPVTLSVPGSGMTAASAVALPDTSTASSVIVLACLGLLLCGAAAYALVHWSREEPDPR
jgi:hypothetical protein